jgi:hypothetical protein
LEHTGDVAFSLLLGVIAVIGHLLGVLFGLLAVLLSGDRPRFGVAGIVLNTLAILIILNGLGFELHVF